MIVELKDEIKDLLQMADTVLLYLTLQTPKTQSALPFYVEVQVRIFLRYTLLQKIYIAYGKLHITRNK